MMMRTAALTLLTALTLVTAPASNAAPILFNVDLSGANEVPSNASPATGTAAIAFDDVLKTLSLDVIFAGLLGPTTAMHIHCCTPPTANAIVATQVPSFMGFPLGVTSGTYSQMFDMTLASFYNPMFIAANGGTVESAFDILVAGMLGGMSYLNIHSMTFPGGEIRGTLNSVPEPGVLSLLGLALVGLAYMRRRQRLS
jgi:CHRD domain/PEP-CTERM motif